jgi:hypothetical protein
MPVEEKWGDVASPAQAGDQVRPLGIAGDEKRLDPTLTQQRGDELHARPLVPRRIRGVEPKQVTQELHGVDLGSADLLSDLRRLPVGTHVQPGR